VSGSGEISTREVQRVGEEPQRPLTMAERYLLETSTEIAFTRRRREIAVSEADAARAELVGCEYRAMGLAFEARRARMPRVLGPRAVHGALRQAADGTAGADGTGEPLVIGGPDELAPVVVPMPPRPREEMAAPPPPAPPTTWERLVGWVTGKAPATAPPLLQSYPLGEEPPSARPRAEQTMYSLDMWGLNPRRTSSSPSDALGKRAGLAQGLLRTVK